MPAILLDEVWLREQWELCEKATPGPWEECGSCIITYKTCREICEMLGGTVSREERIPNADFIVATRTGYPLLIQEVLRLRKLLPGCA